VNDVFSTLIGQDQAVAAMRHYVRHPVHAYLVSGPAGVGTSDAITAFVAGLQCPDHGCGTCEACRRVLSGIDPDVYVAERAGVTWRVDELREAERVSRRRPLGDGFEVVVIPDVELTTTGSSPSAAALLKSLEEPPARTVFVLSAEELPAGLETILSRCVEIRLRGLVESDLIDTLVHEGAPLEAARLAAQAAGGNLQRARVLVSDRALAERIEIWRSVPERLSGTPASALALVATIAAALDAAMAPLVALQEANIAQRHEDAREVGQRTLANRRDLEAQFKREQRRFRIDDLRFGLSALSRVYRDRLVESLDDPSTRARQRAQASLAAIERIAEAARRLGRNVDETLLLADLFVGLADL
jgi:DNA polymerase III subunit delta'